MAAVAQMWHPCPLDDCPVSVVVPVRLVSIVLDDEDWPHADASVDTKPLMEHLRVAHRIVPRPH